MLQFSNIAVFISQGNRTKKCWKLLFSISTVLEKTEQLSHYKDDQAFILHPTNAWWKHAYISRASWEMHRIGQFLLLKPRPKFYWSPLRPEGSTVQQNAFELYNRVSFASTVSFIYQQRFKTFKLCKIKERRRKEIDPLAKNSIHFFWEYSKAWGWWAGESCPVIVSIRLAMPLRVPRFYRQPYCKVQIHL